MQSSNWLFTLNNPECDPFFEHFVYLIYQIEMVSTVHIQGYVVFNTRKTFDTVKRLLPAAHWENRRGTHSQAKAYCSKEESRVAGPYEFGDDSNIPESQGKRSDLLEIQKKLDDGISDVDLAAEHFGSWCRYNKSFVIYRQLKVTPRRFKTEVIVYWGPPGTGKSRRVSDETEGLDTYYKPAGHKWFERFTGSDIVVFDDFRGYWFTFSTVLQILDRYPCTVEIKGGSFNFAPHKIYITSNLPPDRWYKAGHGIVIQSLIRRLDRVEYMGGDPFVTEAFYLSTLPQNE